MRNDPYAKLLKLSKQGHILSSVQTLLEWDQETYMPKDAISQRSSQMEIMANLVHRAKTGKSFAKRLSTLIDIDTGEIKDDKLSSPQIAALREWRRDYINAIKLPSSFIKRFAKTISTASHMWSNAKQHNDFRAFAPYLEKVVSLCRKKADILGYEEHPYDALLDLYEPEMKTSYLTRLFERLKLQLQELLKGIASKPEIRDDFLHQYCPKHKQIELCQKILQKMGFDEETSRLDLSAHPFCQGLHPQDTRMTITIKPDNFFFALFAALHEGGHGLYHRGLPAEHYGSPLCESVSLGIDESQSRWWETLIGQSHSFWHYFHPLLLQEFPEFSAYSLHDFYHAINAVKPSCIRIEADEVTYNLHIIVRFEIEKGLIEGVFKTKDIPDIWNEKMRANLGIAPEHDRDGCLQDIHWSLGYFGYFPTYTLGNLYAVQFFDVFAQKHPEWKQQVAQGNFDTVRKWLGENVHRYGRQYTPTALCEKISGKTLSETAFVRYLNDKYKALYGIL